MTAFQPGQKLLTAQEAADYLTIKKATLYDEVQRGRIECLRGFGREIRFTPEQCDMWLEDRLVLAHNRRGKRIAPPRRIR